MILFTYYTAAPPRSVETLTAQIFCLIPFANSYGRASFEKQLARSIRLQFAHRKIFSQRVSIPSLKVAALVVCKKQNYIFKKQTKGRKAFGFPIKNLSYNERFFIPSIIINLSLQIIFFTLISPIRKLSEKKYYLLYFTTICLCLSTPIDSVSIFFSFCNMLWIIFLS